MWNKKQVWQVVVAAVAAALLVGCEVGSSDLNDSDGDGIPDSDDACPTTGSGEIVNTGGCSPQDYGDEWNNTNENSTEVDEGWDEANENGEQEQATDIWRDEDADGVHDIDDQCPGTPNAEAVDDSGCGDSQKDSDQDGITDDIDECANTPQGSEVGEYGCKIEEPQDADGDGVEDGLDQCPGTVAGNEVDNNGCNVNEQTPIYPYAIVGTNVESCYSNDSEIACPSAGESFYGQNAHYQGNVPSYTDNGDGTITDNVTGLMWQQDMGDKITFSEAITKADTITSGGFDDWRVPTIKELYSLILFSGSNGDGTDENTYVLFIDINCFLQPFGDQSNGERIIDAQTWSATEYVGTTMNGNATVFGVNFIDGRIKGYPKHTPGTQTEAQAYFRLVRGNEDYGQNNFIDNGDGTVSDLSTGSMWQQADDGSERDWENALEYAENLELAGHDDWRLPHAKELQSIVDYSRSLQTTNSAAIDPLFYTTQISDPDDFDQYPYFWTSTTHLDGMNAYDGAAYIAFGEAQGEMNGTLMDVHGAGAQRSDPKTGNPQDYPAFWGPQGDVRYVFNYVRCVRNIE